MDHVKQNKIRKTQGKEKCIQQPRNLEQTSC